MLDEHLLSATGPLGIVTGVVMVLVAVVDGATSVVGLVLCCMSV